MVVIIITTANVIQKGQIPPTFHGVMSQNSESTAVSGMSSLEEIRRIYSRCSRRPTTFIGRNDLYECNYTYYIKNEKRCDDKTLSDVVGLLIIGDP